MNKTKIYYLVAGLVLVALAFTGYMLYKKMQRKKIGAEYEQLLNPSSKQNRTITFVKAK